MSRDYLQRFQNKQNYGRFSTTRTINKTNKYIIEIRIIIRIKLNELVRIPNNNIEKYYLKSF